MCQKLKAEQRALLQYYRPENRALVLSALKRAGRYDLIGTGKNCLVAPDKQQQSKQSKKPIKNKKYNNKKRKK